MTFKAAPDPLGGSGGSGGSSIAGEDDADASQPPMGRPDEEEDGRVAARHLDLQLQTGLSSSTMRIASGTTRR